MMLLPEFLLGAEEDTRYVGESRLNPVELRLQARQHYPIAMCCMTQLCLSRRTHPQLVHIDFVGLFALGVKSSFKTADGFLKTSVLFQKQFARTADQARQFSCDR